LGEIAPERQTIIRPKVIGIDVGRLAGGFHPEASCGFLAAVEMHE
jgi:hypothetical protein